MSFLMPLYALGILAVGLPILFHLIQRRPKGQTEFSSTMFLTASPPRLTKRSRLENWPLLLLRSAAVVLLALAFARPFLRSMTQLAMKPPGRQILVLVDKSASMQREDLWQQASRELDDVLDELEPSDQVALAAFDSTFQSLASFAQTSSIPFGGRGAMMRAAFADVTPTWAATNLGAALVSAADLLHTTAEDREKETDTDAADVHAASALQPEIVLISDLQAGSDIEQLNGYQWPNGIRLRLRPVETEHPGNASLTVLAADPTGQDDGTIDELCVRIRNEIESQQQQFRLQWSSGEMQGNTPDMSPAYTVQVPPGESRVVRVALRDGESLTLDGDDHPFDNRVFVPQQQTLTRELRYVGDRDDDPKTGLSYYLQRATIDTTNVQVEFQQQLPREFLVPPNPNAVPLVVVGPLTISREQDRERFDGFESTLRSYLHSGGRVLVVASKMGCDDQTELLRNLMGLQDFVVGEATVDEYAMLSTIDFRHALFQPFANPRFNDFTKIRFWSHRLMESAELENENRRFLARFDDRSPALIEQAVGEGKLWILAAGWQALESQLALSTKFIPLLGGMFDPSRDHLVARDSFVVGQAVTLSAALRKSPGYKVLGPDQSVVELATNEALVFDEPGVYQVVNGELATPLAINVDSNESRTSLLDKGELEKYGVQISHPISVAQLQDTQRQMRDVELEGGQKIWRWLILVALAVLAIETILGGWFANRQVSEPLAV